MQNIKFQQINQLNQQMILIKSLNKTTLIPLRRNTPLYFMGMLTDKISEKQTKKMQDQFKKQIDHIASKPSFTLMDYKQRIHDELNNLKGSIRKNLSKESGEMQKKLELEKKVVNALFEEELVDKQQVDFITRKEIALVTGVDIKKVTEVFQKADSYRKMHKYLRNLQKEGKPMPESMQELQHKFQRSKFAASGLARRHMGYRTENRRCAGSLRNMRIKFLLQKEKTKKQSNFD